jgi:GNAT superfamily N-acetyltransferase
MEPSFRAASDSDIDMLMEFMRQFYAIDGYPFHSEAARSAMERIVRDQALGRVWLIALGPETIGYVVLTFSYSLEYLGRDAFIDELFIKDAYRGRGIGTHTMQFVLEACPTLGIKALHLEVERHNIAGQRLYQKVGFKQHRMYIMTKRIEH